MAIFYFAFIQVKHFHQISSCKILLYSVSAAHGSVKEEAHLGDIVDLCQSINFKDDIQQVFINFLVALTFTLKGLQNHVKMLLKYL